jgi:hypothetical protein
VWNVDSQNKTLLNVVETLILTFIASSAGGPRHKECFTPKAIRGVAQIQALGVHGYCID